METDHGAKYDPVILNCEPQGRWGVRTGASVLAVHREEGLRALGLSQQLGPQAWVSGVR